MTEKEWTFAMIKPDAVAAGRVGAIITIIEEYEIVIRRMRMATISRYHAEHLYDALAARPFYHDLVDFTVSGPVVLLVLEAEDVVAQWRKLVGATRSWEAEDGTIRRAYGGSEDEPIYRNAVHGSDSPAAVERECTLFGHLLMA